MFIRRIILKTSRSVTRSVGAKTPLYKEKFTSGVVSPLFSYQRWLCNESKERISDFEKANQNQAKCNKSETIENSKVLEDAHKSVMNNFEGMLTRILTSHDHEILIKILVNYSLETIQDADDRTKMVLNLVLGKEYTHLRKYKEAIQSLKEASKYSSIEKIDIFMQIALLSIMEGEHEEGLKYIKESFKSLKEYLESLSLDNNEKCVLLNLFGDLLYNVKLYDEAVEAFKEMLKLIPKNDTKLKYSTLQQLGKAYLELGQYKDGIEIFKECEEIEKNSNDK